MGFSFRVSMGKESLGRVPHLEYADPAARDTVEIGALLEPGWQSGFTVLFRPNRRQNTRVYAGVGLQWATFALRPGSGWVPLLASDSVRQATSHWNTATLEFLGGSTFPLGGHVSLYGEFAYAWRRFRSQNQLLWPITHPPRDGRPYDEWKGGGFQAGIGLLIPLLRPRRRGEGVTEHDFDVELGFRAADFGRDFMDLSRVFPLPDVKTNVTRTVFVALRWHA
jgi:hypothetical protein